MASRRLLFGCIVLGLLASGYATYVHYRLIHDPAFVAACDVSATVSCTQAYQSRFGSLGGVPVALIGFLWFALIFVLLSVGRRDAAFAENAQGYVFLLATLALSVVLYLSYASFFILKVSCPLCMAVYVAVVGIFLISGARASFPMSTLPQRLLSDVGRSGPRAIVTTLLFLIAAGSAVAFFPRDSAPEAASAQPAPAPAQDRTAEFERWYTAQPRVPIIEPAQGAKVLIVDFSDFQCPYCRQAYIALKPILEKYDTQQPGAVRLVLKDYPLDSECNVNVQGGGPHPAACEAAVAVRLARIRNRDAALEEWLFSNQPAMTPDTVRQAAREIGRVTDFEAKYAATLELVKGDIALGKTLGVSATPTLFINGVKIAGVLAPQYLDQAIAFELQRAGK
jgi:uncharacterized membrane protein/protein-disulfide isomerase